MEDENSAAVGESFGGPLGCIGYGVVLIICHGVGIESSNWFRVAFVLVLLGIGAV
jgi:hypothetical protein